MGFKPVSDGAHSWYEMYFSEDSTDWQYLMGTVIPNVDFYEVDYYVIYQNNLNTATFDGLQFCREEYGQSFQYDEKGNVVSTSDLARQKSTFEYNTSSDLVKSVDPKGSSFTYEYSVDGKRNLVTNSYEARTGKLLESTLYRRGESFLNR